MKNKTQVWKLQPWFKDLLCRQFFFDTVVWSFQTLVWKPQTGVLRSNRDWKFYCALGLPYAVYLTFYHRAQYSTPDLYSGGRL